MSEPQFAEFGRGDPNLAGTWNVVQVHGGCKIYASDCASGKICSEKVSDGVLPKKLRKREKVEGGEHGIVLLGENGAEEGTDSIFALKSHRLDDEEQIPPIRPAGLLPVSWKGRSVGAEEESDTSLRFEVGLLGIKEAPCQRGRRKLGFANADDRASAFLRHRADSVGDGSDEEDWIAYAGRDESRREPGEYAGSESPVLCLKEKWLKRSSSDFASLLDLQLQTATATTGKKKESSAS
ncbi:hypothetical protein C8R45DRAFT_923162 [Mycena sanguinolenta]|nr:hypothetical protein C8R45DRAFT_923162 [Mycena sanguinolenta]